MTYNVFSGTLNLTQSVNHVQKSRPSSYVKVKGQVSRWPGTRKRKTAESSTLTHCIVRGAPLHHTLHAAADYTIASQPGVTGWWQYKPTAACGSGPRRRGHWGPCVRQFYAGGKINACCLVSYIFWILEFFLPHDDLRQKSTDINAVFRR